MKIMSKLLATSVLCVSITTAGFAANKDSSETLRMLDLYGDIFEKVRTDYVEDVNDKELIEASLNGMLSSLDPHSGYLNTKAFDEMKVQTRGEFGGLGIEVTMENGLVKVVSPIDETPAAEAGIQSGDLISSIDEKPVMGLSLSEAVEKMRGKVNTKIKITVLREGEEKPLDFEITRAVIKIRSVRHRVEGDIGYLRITSFSEKTSDNLEKAYKKVKKEIGDDIKGIVLDLRNNPGGLLDQAIAVSDIFLDHGEIVSTRGKMKGSTKRYSAKNGDLTNNTPIVVLINGGSASASEIVAGALQDHKRALVIGGKSFGKGSVQTVIPVPGDGAIRLTTSRYYTPSGRSIQAEGIVPDIEIPPIKVELIKKKGSRYSEANLRGHLENNSKDRSNKNGKTEEENSLYEKDYVLARAIDLLHGINLYSNIVQ